VSPNWTRDDGTSDFDNYNCKQCYTCLDDRSLGFQNPVMCRMILCPSCGNKRCPKATFHGNECTGSNEPGQPGSNY